MIMPRGLRGSSAIFHGEFEDAPLGKLPGVGAVDFLPGGVAGRYWRRSFRLAAGDFVGLDQRLASALIEVDADDVAGAEPRQATARGAFGRGIDDRRTV